MGSGKMAKIKSLYKGRFNFHHEVFIEHAFAYTALQAKCIMIRRIANKHGVSYLTTYNYFHDHADSCSVKIETLFKEV